MSKIVDKNQLNKYSVFNKIMMFLQMINTILVIVIAIMTIFKPVFNKYFELLLGIDFLIMAINNLTVYKRGKITILYVCFGLFMIVMSVLRFIGVEV